ncbi:MAG: helix-turn-helix domain-containing protein [Rhodospirillaceae bacterium]|nr:helix-turn-helix domain-containing protein [Rhodospirillaceae bacterium]
MPEKTYKIAPPNARSHQIPSPPDAGFLTVIEGEPYKPFPRGAGRLWDRMEWTRDAPVAKPDDKAGPAIKAVLWLLALHANETGFAFPSHKTLAREGCMGTSTVTRAIKALVEGGWLVKQKRGRAWVRYWPKSPADAHCGNCWRCLPRGEAVCPTCGFEQQGNLPLSDAHIGLRDAHIGHQTTSSNHQRTLRHGKNL